MSSVLFISHYSGRNGAPLVLLRLLHWLKSNTQVEAVVLIKARGELEVEFSKVSKLLYPPRLPRIISDVARRTFGTAVADRLEDALLRRSVRQVRPSLIFSNTITNTREVAALGQLGVPIVCHVHEMEYWIRYELGLQSAIHCSTFVRRFIAVSEATKAFLCSGVRIPADRIDLVHDFSFLPPTRPANTPELRLATRAALKVTDRTFVIGACGSVDWRKGADLFISTARALLDSASGIPFHFVWVGGPLDGKFFQQLQHDISRSGIAAAVSFVGPCQHPEQYYAAMDAFLLTSREDPCPLVMLEAAAFELPIISFSGSGGATEFVADDAGIAVPYLDISSMAEAALRVARSPELCKRLGRNAMVRARTRHDGNKQSAAIFETMKIAQPSLGPVPSS